MGKNCKLTIYFTVFSRITIAFAITIIQNIIWFALANVLAWRAFTEGILKSYLYKNIVTSPKSIQYLNQYATVKFPLKLL